MLTQERAFPRPGNAWPPRHDTSQLRVEMQYEVPL